MRHVERHKTHRMSWLRAAVLGANDGIVSTASLIVGVVASGAPFETVLMAGIAGLVAGAMSMAAGEYVSVSSQADTERADLAREKVELATDPEHEHLELTEIYISRGLEEELASEVAAALMAHDALGAHARDELGITDIVSANPIQAALASASSFAIGALLPLLVVLAAPMAVMAWSVALCSLVFLAVLGALSAKAGGARLLIAASRVTFWGALAMLLTALAGTLFGAAG